MNEISLQNFKVSSFEFLNNIEIRTQCQFCLKSRMYFCYSCFKPLPVLEDKIPKLKLPFKIEILKHPGEVCGKSTAVHAAILAPDDVTIRIYPDIPQYDSHSKTVLVCPGANSVTIEDYLLSSNKIISNIDCTFGEHFENDSTHETSLNLIEKVIFIDSTWFQVHKIASDIRLKVLTKIELKSYETKFWRPQLDKPSTYLSTIEAIYYCVKEYHDLLKKYRFSFNKSGIISEKTNETSNQQYIYSNDKVHDLDIKNKVNWPYLDCNNISNNIIKESCIDNKNYIVTSSKELNSNNSKYFEDYLENDNVVKSSFDQEVSGKNIEINSVEEVDKEMHYDNLLFFFCFFYSKIRREASKSNRILKSYELERGSRKKRMRKKKIT